jgi:hypothetical protein
VDEGVNIPPRGQISPLGARGEVRMAFRVRLATFVHIEVANCKTKIFMGLGYQIKNGGLFLCRIKLSPKIRFLCIPKK